MTLRKITLQVVALTAFALGLIWMSGSGVAVQSSTAEADNIYEKLHSDVYAVGDVIYADTVQIDAGGESGVLKAEGEEPDNAETLFKSLKSFTDIAYKVKNKYMEDIDTRDMIHAGIRGMLQNLDPFSVLMEQESYDRLMESTHGKYEGLGMQIDSREDHIRIISPIEGTPAYRKGLQAGDVIWEINGTSTYQMDSQEAANLMRGPAGTSVDLKIKRQGVPDLLEYEVERAVIELKSVNYYGYIGDSDIGYIRLSRFAEETGNELKEALTDLKAQKDLGGVIFDLRSNGGGLLHQAVETANLFLDKEDLIVYTRGKAAQSERRYHAVTDPIVPEGKLVILVDEGTASASEIVAGAIQDWDRGIIMGEPTYGKGLVQQIYPVSHDPSVALKLTTAKYYIPSGRCIQRPDRSKKKTVDEMIAAVEGHDAEGEEPADSLVEEEREVYFTNAGRVVYGGGGIFPDIEVERERWYPIEMNLERKQMFFDFAVQYSAKHPEIDRDFEVTNDILAEFKAFTIEREFDYKTALEVSLEEMQDVVKDENKEELFSESLEQFAKLIEKEKEADFERSTDYIKRSIKREIMSKLYGQRGMYEEIILKTDPAVQKAIELMQDEEEYTKLIEEGRTQKAEL
jgi:carboxyl-terminal processing protease